MNLIEQMAEAIRDCYLRRCLGGFSERILARAALGVVEKWLRLNGNAYVSGATLADELLNKLRAAMAKEAKRD